MTFSGLVKDPNAGMILGGSYPRRAIMFTAVAAVLGWVFTSYMPQIPDMSGRFVLGAALAIGLALMTVSVSDERGQRLFAAVLMAVAFTAGMWGLWIEAQFGDIPTIDQIRSVAAGQTYALQSFGEPFEVRNYVFELWVGMTAFFAAVPILFGMMRPRPAGMRHNPYSVHSDFESPFGTRLLFLPLAGFGIAAAAVYGFQYLDTYNIPIEAAVLPPLLVGFMYARLHMIFPRALFLSIFGGIAAAAGFWVPWLYQTAGQDGMIAFFTGAPDQILTRVETLANGVGYISETYGTTTNYTPWVFEIWIGLTLAYLGLPLLITLLRRFFYLMRAS